MFGIIKKGLARPAVIEAQLPDLLSPRTGKIEIWRYKL